MNDYYRAFTWSSKAWYAKDLKRPGENPNIYFGLYNPKGGTCGEMCVEWIELSGKQTPRLVVFNDAWKALQAFKDVIDSLAICNAKDITQEEFVSILKNCGFSDETVYTDVNDDFDAILVEIINESPAANLLSIPGVYEEVREHFNNDVLSRWESRREEGS